MAGYEINKQEGVFVSANFLAEQAGDANSGVASRPNDNELSRETEAARQKRPQFSDGSKRTQHNWKKPYEICVVEEAVSACFHGKIDSVQKYLNKFQGTDDYKIFLHGEDHNGHTALHLVVMEQDPDMADLLLRHGSDVNARDHKGRTPLMEAALWGRRENVRVLLEHKADKTLRDKSGKLAIDLAQHSKDNAEERARRVEKYKEETYLAWQDRSQIDRIMTGKQKAGITLRRWIAVASFLWSMRQVETLMVLMRPWWVVDR
uniref:Uncharacterized protein n=1 Tax=Globisporangium ultimum (strain ATCC 200006 / CBS 805.95 / DAOM BR144) TaxID=431595 RepID=K3WNN1_GLOUD